MKAIPDKHDPKQLRAALLAATLSLLLATASSQAQQIACGQTIRTNISVQGQTDDYTFYANVGDVVVVSTCGQPGYYFNAAADVYDSIGRLGGCTNGATPPLTVRASGLCVILVHADDFNHVGTYGVSLALVHRFIKTFTDTV
jgi:hypothetical protein